jgi:hypothetical protein
MIFYNFFVDILKTKNFMNICFQVLMTYHLYLRISRLAYKLKGNFKVPVS